MYFDIGSNIGSWALNNQQNYNKKIICIEASPITYKKLEENIKNKGYELYKTENNNLSSLYVNNNKQQIEILNYAVCDSNNSEIIFYDCENDNPLSTINKDWLENPNSRFYGCNYKEKKVPTIKIDKLIEEYGIPELIKIDVEGGEYECIKSLTNNKIKNICFEWASELNVMTFKCLDYLNKMGFNEFYLQYEDNYLFRPFNYNETIETIKLKLLYTTPKKEWGMIWCNKKKININLTIITSIINPPKKPLSYINTRSVYTKEERYTQTKKTIKTLNEKIENNKILLIECSQLTKEEREYFEENTDIFINLYDYNNREINENIWSVSKSLGEGTMMINALKYIFEQQIEFTNLYKISGRYWLNDEFKNTNDEEMLIRNIENEDSVVTSLYKLPKEIAYMWYIYLLKTETIEMYNNCIGYEMIFGKFLKTIQPLIYKKNYKNIGISGNISVCGSRIDY